MISPTTELAARLSLVVDDINYIGFASNFDTPNGTETIASSLNMIGKTELTKVLVNNLITFTYTIGTTQAVCPFDTVANSGSTTTVIKTTDTVSTNFKVNDRVQIGTEQDNKIISIDTGANTFTLLNPLTAVPTSGTSIKVKISMRFLIRGGDITLSTGTVSAIEPFTLYKTSSETIPGRVTGNDI